jgi:hypothetical protein
MCICVKDLQAKLEEEQRQRCRGTHCTQFIGLLREHERHWHPSSRMSHDASSALASKSGDCISVLWANSAMQMPTAPTLCIIIYSCSCSSVTHTLEHTWLSWYACACMRVPPDRGHTHAGIHMYVVTHHIITIDQAVGCELRENWALITNILKLAGGLDM